MSARRRLCAREFAKPSSPRRSESPRFWEDRLRDTLEAVEEIFEFTSGMDEGALAADAKTLKAVLADFAIIGEAATHLPEGITNR